MAGSAHSLPRNWLAAPFSVADPGTGGTFNLDNKGVAYCKITSTTTETRTIPAPEVAGQMIFVALDTDGGNVTITITGGQGVSSVVLNDAGDAFSLISTTTGGTAKWQPAWSTGALSGFPSNLGGNVDIPGTLAVAGASTFAGRMTTTDGVSSGTARVIGGLAYSNTAASTTIGNTGGAETLFDLSYAIPANTLKAGTKVRVRYAGFGVTGIGSDTFAHKLYVGGSGGTALITSATAVLATNGTFTGETELICRTAGTTGTIVAFGTYKQSSAEGTMTTKDDYLASTTCNTTAAQTIAVTGVWNSNNANSARLDILFVEVV
jgi:hypothetical protein